MRESVSSSTQSALRRIVHETAVEHGAGDEPHKIYAFGSSLRQVFNQSRDGEQVGADPRSPGILVAVFTHRGSFTLDERFKTVEDSFGYSEPPEEVLIALEGLLEGSIDIAIQARASEFLFIYSSGRNRFSSARRSVRLLFDAADAVVSSDFLGASRQAKRAVTAALSMNNTELLGTVFTRVHSWLDTVDRCEESLGWAVELSRLVRLVPTKKLTRSAGLMELRDRCTEVLEAEIMRGGYEQSDDVSQWALFALDELEELSGETSAKRAARLRYVTLQERDARSRDSAAATAYLLMSAVETLKQTNSLYGKTDEVTSWIKRLESEVVNYSGKSQAEMNVSSTTIEFKKEDLERDIEACLEPRTEEGRLRSLLACCYVPEPKQLEDEVREQLDGFVFWRIGPQINFGDGRPSGVLGSGEQRFQFQVNRHLIMLTQIRVDTLFVPVLRRMMLEDLPELQRVAGVFIGYGISTQAQAMLLERGFALWRDGYVLEAIHLLVPQIEVGLRKLMDTHGHGVVRSKRGGVYHVETLDSVIEKALEAGLLGATHKRILQTLLTSAGNGPNIRNRVCHGLIDDLNSVNRMCDFVVYALFILLHAAVRVPPTDTVGMDEEE